MLIVGGGPVGLSLALQLSRWGVDWMLVERHAEVSEFPKGRTIGLRSMEIFRQTGLEAQIQKAGLAPEETAHFYFGPSLTSREDFELVSRARAAASVAHSPTASVICSQEVLEALLRDETASAASGDALFGAELATFNEHQDGVTALLRDRSSGREWSVEAAYMVAADGASSMVRRSLKIELTGASELSHNLNIFFEADLRDLVVDRLSLVYFVSNEAVQGTFLAVDNHYRWLLNVVGDAPRLRALDDDACVELVRSATGAPDVAIGLRDRKVWTASSQVAESYSRGRVFLAGDAAHVMTPYGGFGMNCGLADAHNLGWKLAGVVHGWAGDGLLDTYERERKRVAQWTSGEDLANIVAAHGDPAGPRDWRAWRNALPRRRQNDGLTLGYAYSSSAISPDGSDVPHVDDPVASYVPCARPGHRAPHHWLRRSGDRLSTLDLFGNQFTLLTAAGAGGWREAMLAARRGSRVPLRAHAIGDGAALRDDGDAGLSWAHAYGVEPGGAVLVRPDGHVAWRTVTQPSDPERTLKAALQRAVVGAAQ